MAPDMHAIINAKDMPDTPNHKPPTPNNFMSPMPIGVSDFGFLRRKIASKIKPIVADMIYPNVAPVTASWIDSGKP